MCSDLYLITFDERPKAESNLKTLAEELDKHPADLAELILSIVLEDVDLFTQVTESLE